VDDLPARKPEGVLPPIGDEVDVDAQVVAERSVRVFGEIDFERDRVILDGRADGRDLPTQEPIADPYGCRESDLDPLRVDVRHRGLDPKRAEIRDAGELRAADDRGALVGDYPGENALSVGGGDGATAAVGGVCAILPEDLHL
jgi:hypothetical protein